MDWSGSTNLGSTSVRFPAPRRIDVGGGLFSVGYYDAVILPVEVRAADPARPVILRLALEIGVCEKICIPAEVRLQLTIPSGTGKPVPALDAAEARVPRKVAAGERPGLAVLAVKLERGKEPRALIDVAVPEGGKFDLFAEGPTGEWSLPLPALVKTAGARARFLLPIDGAPPRSDPIPSGLRLTLVAGEDAIEVEVPLD
jgi:DsbC/DsbD-like thiol-disulfide interchange protein